MRQRRNDWKDYYLMETEGESDRDAKKEKQT